MTHEPSHMAARGLLPPPACGEGRPKRSEGQGGGSQKENLFYLRFSTEEAPTRRAVRLRSRRATLSALASLAGEGKERARVP